MTPEREAELREKVTQWTREDTRWSGTCGTRTRLLAELLDALASERAAREKAERIALGLLRMHTWRCDHACAQCTPGGEIVIPSYVCAYHEALALRATRASPARERP